MKTAVEIAEPLMVTAKRVAQARRTTVRALIEAGLRRTLEEQERDVPHLRDGSFQGQGLNPEFAEMGWPRIREAIYEGRGT
jgi:hypothetical protein